MTSLKYHEEPLLAGVEPVSRIELEIPVLQQKHMKVVGTDAANSAIKVRSISPSKKDLLRERERDKDVKDS